MSNNMKTQLPLIYIAGPFRADTAWGIHCNVIAAEKLALRVACVGGFPVCPHKNAENFHSVLSDGFWLAGTLTLMRKCDAVAVVDGWLDSVGTTQEIQDAENLHIPVFYNVMKGALALQEWIYRFKQGGKTNES